MTSTADFSFYEFFSGGGMATAGLGKRWKCLFANDFDKKKAAAYTANWASGHLHVEDIALLETDDLPGQADLAWASFPFQDLSLAGASAGLRGNRSGTFWPFWRLMQQLASEGRGPGIIALENVFGALRSRNGKDFSAIAQSFADIDYQVGAVIIDAVHFLPQSRPRLFVIGVRPDLEIPAHLTQQAPSQEWHPKALTEARQKLSSSASDRWVWWSLPQPHGDRPGFSDIIEDEPQGVNWHTMQETQRLLDMMTDVNRAKVRAAQSIGKRIVAGVYRRTRNGVQRAEVRIDNVAGCLRTPSGGSSRQTVLIIEGANIRSRLLSPREAARLMGLPDEYKLPERYNDAYHLAGDGVAVPVVRFLSDSIFSPLLQANYPVSNVA